MKKSHISYFLLTVEEKATWLCRKHKFSRLSCKCCFLSSFSTSLDFHWSTSTKMSRQVLESFKSLYNIKLEALQKLLRDIIWIRTKLDLRTTVLISGRQRKLFLVKIFGVKLFLSKFFLGWDFFGQKFFGAKNFFGWNFFWWKFVGGKFFGWNFSGWNFFRVKIFGVKICLTPAL